MAPEIGPKSFETFEKQVPGCLAAVSYLREKKQMLRGVGIGGSNEPKPGIEGEKYLCIGVTVLLLILFALSIKRIWLALSVLCTILWLCR